MGGVTSAGLSRLSVGIIGCGTAGPAVARLLARQGATVTLFERAPDPGPIGAGITLQPTGLSVLHQLGVLPQVLAAGSPIERLYGRTMAGRTVLDLKYRSLHPDYFGLGIHRGSLFFALMDGLEGEGVRLFTGAGVRSFVEREDGVELCLDTGQRCDFDLAIVCDGARSKLRALVGECEARPYSWGALWAVLPLVGEGFQTASIDGVALKNTLLQVFDGTRRFVGFLPTGIAKDSGRPVLSLFWSQRTREFEEQRARGIDAFKDEILHLIGQAPPEKSRPLACALGPVLDQLTSTEQLLPATYYDAVMKRPHTRRVVVLGDAAHAMSPQLGQGANLALYDAWVLSEVLGESSKDVERALELFGRRRESHWRFYQWATRLLTPFFQSDWEILGTARDLTMGALCQSPFFGRQGLSAMAGFKTGIFGSVPVARRLGRVGGQVPWEG